MLKSIIRVTLVMILFVLILVWFIHHDKERSEIIKKQLQNNVSFTGKVIKIDLSGNHAFGVILTEVRHKSISKFVDDHLSNKRFPYLVMDAKAEIYTRISDGIKVGDSVHVESNKETVYYYDSYGKQKGEEYMYIISDPFDIRFIDENSKLQTGLSKGITF